mgnify:CR=1 FL=1
MNLFVAEKEKDTLSFRRLVDSVVCLFPLGSCFDLWSSCKLQRAKRDWLIIKIKRDLQGDYEELAESSWLEKIEK